MKLPVLDQAWSNSIDSIRASSLPLLLISPLYLSRVSAQQQDPAAYANGLRNRVRDEQNGEFRVVPKLEEFLLHAGAGECVEGREGLVDQ